MSMETEDRCTALEILGELGQPLERDGVWVRVSGASMAALPVAGWKLHVSATPANYAATLAAASRVLVDAGCPFKCIADIELLEELNDGRYGLLQAGKVITAYCRTEEEASKVGAALVAALRGAAGPQVLTDVSLAAGAPVFYRYGPFGGGSSIDALGRKRRMVVLPNGEEIEDRPFDERLPKPLRLPVQPPHDHLDYLREKYLIVTALHVNARGGVFVAVLRDGGPRVPLLIKTARAHAQCDRHGRDAIWALRREHGHLQRLSHTGVTPGAGELVASPSGDTLALVRPYLSGETLIELWQSAASRTADARAHHSALLLSMAQALHALHASGVVLRDLSPANVLCRGEQVAFIDLELAHAMDDESPPFRRGTPGFYDADKARDAAPAWRDDAYAMLSVAHWLHTGVHPQWSREGAAATGDRIAPVPVDARFQQAWRTAAAAMEGEEFFHAFTHVAMCVDAVVPPPKAWSWDVARTLKEWGEALGAKLRQLPGKPDPDAANVFTGVAGELLAFWECGGDVDALSVDGAVVSAWLGDSAHLVAHIAGQYFGGSGIALAQLLLGDAAAARGSLLGAAWQESEVPDLCHGLAGYLSALLAAHRHTGEKDYLARAQEVAARLGELAEREGAGCRWRWPEGDYAGLSGVCQYGYAHGVAGIVGALSGLHRIAPDDALAEQIRGAVAFLSAGALPVPGEDKARWWPVSDEDEACWNAWSHGTPGVLKGLCAAHLALPDAVPVSLMTQALEGIRAANNAGYCLCHGIASRLDAYVDAAHALGAQQPTWLRDEALTDAARLAALDVWAIERRVRPEAGDDGYGLLKGAAGVVRTLSRFDSAFRAGAFVGPGGHASLDGKVLTGEGLERGAVGRGCFHGHFLD